MPTWKPLAERLANLPLVLAGPIVRRVGPDAATVWVALREPRAVTLRIYTRGGADDLSERLTGTRQTVRFGEHLHIVVVTAKATTAEERLPAGTLLYYDLFFAQDGDANGPVASTAPHLETPGVLVMHPETCSPVQRLVYEGHPLPAFVLPPQDIGQLRIFHGSCRRPTGEGADILAALDQFVEAEANSPERRPPYLFFTGDQVYGEGVALPLLYALMDSAATLGEYGQQEVLPLVNQRAAELGPGLRKGAVRKLARFTTPDPSSHLLSRAEYAMMYLFSWSDVLWPEAFAPLEEIRTHYPQEHPLSSHPWKLEAKTYVRHLKLLEEFRATLPQVRRALANIPTYMICDDHDVTDDWFLDGAWCRDVLASPLGRRIVRNALLNYALFQGWGNDPEQFEDQHGAAFLQAVDTWQGDEEAQQAEVFEEILGIPPGFSGTGELAHSPRSLRWHYTLAGPGYRIIVLNTRTRRFYPKPSSPPGLLSPQAMAEQLADYDPNLTILISAAPLLSLHAAEDIQIINPMHRDNYAYDREAWALERRTFQHFLAALGHMGRVVVLSGDVHYGFGAVLESWEETQSPPASSRIVSFTSSSLRNEAEGVDKALLAVLRPESLEWLSQAEMHPIEEFVWEKTRAFVVCQAALRAVSSIWWRLFWTIARQIARRHPNALLVLPARGWPRGTFDEAPPEVRTRLRYLRALHPAEVGNYKDWPVGNYAGNGDSEPATNEMDKASADGANQEVSESDEPDASYPSFHHFGMLLQGARERPSALEHRLVGFRTERLKKRVKRHDLSPHHPESKDYLVTRTNLGEIRFDWQRKEVVQGLWYPAQSADDQASVAVALYRTSLEGPPANQAPRLPERGKPAKR